MKKKALAILVCLILTLALAAAPALANDLPPVLIGGLSMEPGDYYVNGEVTGVGIGNPNVKLGEVYSPEPTTEPTTWNAKLEWSAESGYTLTLDGLILTEYTAGPCIAANVDLTVQLINTNSDLRIRDEAAADTHALQVAGDLTIKAEKKKNAEYYCALNVMNDKGHGIYATGDITLDSGDINPTTHASGKTGIWTGGSLTVGENARLTAIASTAADNGYAVYVTDTLTVQGEAFANAYANGGIALSTDKLKMDGGVLSAICRDSESTAMQIKSENYPIFDGYGADGYQWKSSVYKENDDAYYALPWNYYPGYPFDYNLQHTYIRIEPGSGGADKELVLTYTNGGGKPTVNEHYYYEYNEYLGCMVLTIIQPGEYTLSMAEGVTSSNHRVHVNLIEKEGSDVGPKLKKTDSPPVSFSAVELTLNNVNLELSPDDLVDEQNGSYDFYNYYYYNDFGCIENRNADLTLVLKGQNSISLTGELSAEYEDLDEYANYIAPCAIVCISDEEWLQPSDLTISGSGRLDISGGFSYGIAGNQVNFRGGTTDINIEQGASPFAPYAALRGRYVDIVSSDPEDVPATHALNIGENMQLISDGSLTWDNNGWNIEYACYLPEYLLDEEGDDVLQATIRPKSTDNDNSGGGGGAPVITVPASSDEGSIKVNATVSGGTAKVTVTEAQLEQIISDDAPTGTVKVDASQLKVEAAIIPAQLVDAAAAASGSQGLEVVLPSGAVTLDNTALASIGNKEITVSVQEIKSDELTESQRQALGDRADTALVIDVTVLVNGAKTSDFNGGVLTVSVPYTPKAGEDVSKLVVWYLADDGSIEPMKGAYNEATKCYEFTTNHLSAYVLTSFPFTDVAVDSYYYSAIAWAVANNVTNGTSATVFSPDYVCTRAQTVAFLWRAMGSPEPTATVCPFTDVSADDYYYKAVLWAVEKGITKGTSATTFSPDATVSRGEVVTFLWCAAGQPAAAATNMFADVPAGAYYQDAVAWAVSEKITEGTGPASFSPAAPCTRGQIVTFLYRYLA